MSDQKFHITELAEGGTYQDHLEEVTAYLNNVRKVIDYKGVDLVQYTRLNLEQMRKWNKSITIVEDLTAFIRSIKKEIEFVVITEGWCLDAAHVLPVVYKLTELNEKLRMKVILRDKNPDVMNEYLTDGSKSIPIVIALDRSNELVTELFNWGPKPVEMIEYTNEYYNDKLDLSFKEFVDRTNNWYVENKTKSIQKELYSKLRQALD